MKKLKYIHIIFILLLFSFTACDNQRVYEKWVDVEDFVWSQDSSYVFEFDITDSLALYNVNFGLRHLNQYPYQNIWLLSTLEGPDSLVYSDTIQYVLADEHGMWYGKRSAGINNYVKRMYSALPFIHTGHYKITLSHGMREQLLTGVSGVGVRIENYEQ